MVFSEFDALGCRQAVILYDLIPYENPETYLNNEKDAKNYERLIRQLTRSDLILAISGYTTKNFIEKFCKKSISEIVTYRKCNGTK